MGDKGTGKAEKITITAEKGRLSQEEIDEMVRAAEEYAEEDKRVKERIDARNGLESYLYNIKNMLDDDEKGLGDKLGESDKKELEKIVNPIMKELYQGAGMPGGPGGDDEEDFD